ncbi:Casein Kinase 2 substrate protein [Dioscorea alata]|uniref:Casein Kinase 2 substrate protein n=2 Tax=Dioscorea alata TaxID=55571 RepID=A0ACB7W437_DIOAL|nr:Casein Kinase 2 substrate protein [Dioscorea alata]
MEPMMKKFQQKYRRARDEMDRWDELQSRLVSQFVNASSIIDRLDVLRDTKNYGILGSVNGIKETLLGKQMEALEMIFCSMKETMKEFYGIVMSFEKIASDGNQLLRGGSIPTAQKQLKIGIWPSLEECVDGLQTIHEMHQSEYLLKSSIVSSLTWKCSASDIGALRQLLMDQPNISTDEVQSIFEIIFAEDIS